MARVLVTGANGFVGGALVNRLPADGHDVIAAVRDGRNLAPTETAGRTIAVSDPWSATAWQHALDGIEVVIHLIALTHTRHVEDLEPYRRVNVGITSALLTAMRTTATRRMVYVSSIKAVGEGATHVAYRENTVARPRDAYGMTKREAELTVLRARDDHEVVVIRPPVVVGAGAKGNFDRLARAVAARWPLPLGLARARRSTVALENLVDALALVAQHPRAAGEVLHVADDETLTVREAVESIGEVMGTPARLIPVPPAVLRAAATPIGRRGDVERLFTPLVVDASRLRHRLGWTAPATARDGLGALARAVASDTS